MKETIAPHDRFFRFIFSKKENLRDLVLNALPDEVIRILDLGFIEVYQDSFIDQKLAVHQSDILIRTRFKKPPVLIYILVEHKSYPYRWTVFQLLKYMVCIWERELAQTPKMEKLPLIIPLIFYHGSRKWKFPIDFSSCFAQSEEINLYIPAFKTHLYDLQQMDDRYIHGHMTFQAALKTMKHAMQNLRPHLGQILNSLSSLPFDDEVNTFLSAFFKYILEVGKGAEAEDIEEELKTINFKEAREVYMTIAEQLEERGIEKGKLEGEILEKQHILMRLLEKKFGLKETEKEKILNTRNRHRLDRAIDRLMDAQSSAEVLSFLE